MSNDPLLEKELLEMGDAIGRMKKTQSAPDSCGNCYYRRVKGVENQCRREGPRVFMFLMMRQSPMGPAPEVMSASNWPKVELTDWCAQHTLAYPQAGSTKE